MRLFTCRSCGQTVFFENILCESCGHALGYLSRARELLTLEPHEDGYKRLGARQTYRYCDNATDGVCNWLIPTASTDRFCTACQPNRIIPDLSVPEALGQWQRLEAAKHRLFYTLGALGLPTRSYLDDPEHGLAFEFLADSPGIGPRVLTGHEEGLITINLAEADDAQRETFRAAMGEPYRTLLGHFRHVIGHYFWNLLLRDTGRLDDSRTMFGDEEQDYAAALQAHYQNGPPADWQDNYISAYAASHPWEDFAETWAHYLHIVDTLETASAFGLRIHPRNTNQRLLHADIRFNPHEASSIDSLIIAWLPLTLAVNSLNRSMGLADLYPFTIAPRVIEKLGFIHSLVHEKSPAEPASVDETAEPRSLDTAAI